MQKTTQMCWLGDEAAFGGEKECIPSKHRLVIGVQDTAMMMPWYDLFALVLTPLHYTYSHLIQSARTLDILNAWNQC